MASREKKFDEMTELKAYVYDNCYSIGRLVHKLDISSTAYHYKVDGCSLFREREKKILQEVFRCSDEEIDRLIPQTWESYWAVNGKTGGR